MRRFASLFLGLTAIFAGNVSGAPAGLLQNILTPVVSTVSAVVTPVASTVSSVVTPVASTVATVVDPLLEPKNVIITIVGGNAEALNSVAPITDGLTAAERTLRIETLTSALQLLAQVTQAPVVQLLTGLVFETLWITNQIVVKNCPHAVVELIRALPIVKEVVDDLIITLDPIQPTADSTNNTAAAGWGAAKIRAPDVWTTGKTGQNVVVATIDSGVLGSHETLKNNFVGLYGWYDPANKTATPYDNNGHGTHTMASIAGGLGVGIAPSAKWMTCKGCTATSCVLSLLTTCAQFMLCPTDTTGKNCNAAKAPHIVSNSWGAGQGMTYFQASLDAWHTAGIIPVFANGNSGRSGCGTALSPGDSAKAFAVGATDINDVLGDFSSLGPSVNGLVKPDFTGPGVSVRSAWNGNNADYMSLSGTSMAAPHVAGTMALALSARPGLCFDGMKAVLSGATDRTLPAAAQTCGGTSGSVFPNNQYGYGRINALKAVNAAIAY
ncbi:hypothetical protein BBJ28_00009757 [Nothophytophthora sp. Chile5]|nr:hypothetical protein BBJ28_00009757 [Nothophytophthora sp. Chile5]